MITTSQLKETDYLKAWAFFWVLATIGGFIVGAVFGGILGFILGAIGVNIRTIQLLSGALGFLLAIPISYFLFRLAVIKFILPKVAIRNESVPELRAA